MSPRAATSIHRRLKASWAEMETEDDVVDIALGMKGPTRHPHPLNDSHGTSVWWRHIPTKPRNPRRSVWFGYIIINEAGTHGDVGVEDAIVSVEPNDDFAMGAPPGAVLCEVRTRYFG